MLMKVSKTTSPTLVHANGLTFVKQKLSPS